VLSIPNDLDGARLNVSRTAELVSMDPAHFRRLVRRGVFPSPKKTSKNLPFYDYSLLLKLAEVLKTGIGVSGEEICFYRRKSKKHQPRRRKSREEKKPLDEYLLSVIEGCKELGITEDKLDPETVSQILSEEFGDDRPKLREVLPVVARRILQE